MNPLVRFVSLVAFAGVLFVSVSARAALRWASTGSYPQRSNSEKVIAATNADGSFNKNAANAGISRADCLDVTQEWRLFWDSLSIPSDAAAIEVYAKVSTDTASNCDSIADRTGEGGTQTCYKIAHFERAAVVGATGPVIIHPYQIIAAAARYLDATNTSLVNPTTAVNDICQATSDGLAPQAIVLWSVAMKDSRNATGDSTNSNSLALQTAYDISGIPAPDGITLGAGNTIINAHFSFNATAFSDFGGLQAYCWPRSDFDAAGVVTDTGASTDTSVATDSGTTDTGTGDADETGTTTDTGTTTVTDSGTTTTDVGAPVGECPSDTPFVGGQLPPAGLVPCGEVAATATTVTLEGLTNNQPYAVALAGRDLWGNPGKLSQVTCITPKETVDFYSAYRAAGGTGGGGYCAFSASRAVPVGFGISVVGLALLGRVARRRSRR